MGDEAATTGVETDTTGDDTNDTLLTGDDTGATDQNSDAGAADTASADDDTTGEGQTGGEAGEEGSDTVPETYADFDLPEGMSLDETALSEATPLFKELGLTQEQSQKVIDLYSKQIQAGSQNQVDTFNQLMDDWRTQSQNDKEFGGDKFDENIKIAQNAIGKYGTPELKQLLEEHGVGNHPEVVRFMVRVGRTLKEDVPGDAGGNTSPAADRVSILYPNANQS